MVRTSRLSGCAMTSLGYDDAVRRWISASVVIFGLLLLPAFLVSSSPAQINGVPASVTSPGFGGHPGTNAPPASVTSLGPRGYAPSAGGIFFSNMPGRDEGSHRHHRDRDRGFIPYYGGWYGAPTYPYPGEDAGYEDEEEPDSPAGPTIFDRRGRGDRAYLPPPSDAVRAHPDPRTDRTAEIAAPEAPPPPTTLVFKDGHRLEVGNYAIVGATMFDLTPGHPRKIALADVDLEATQKENEDHGVSFRLPSNSQAN
jgi:hypothetical protein